ncbi:hypothetical protein D3C73_933670 [compost metagenome]
MTRMGDDPLAEIFKMRNEPEIVDAILIQIDAEMIFDNVHDLLQQLHQMRHIIHRIIYFGIDKMKRNIADLILGKINPQPFLQNGQRLFGHIVLSLVEVLYLPRKRVANNLLALHPLYSEVDMI